MNHAIPAAQSTQVSAHRTLLLDRARSLLPQLRERFAATLDGRRLPADTVADLHREGLLKALQPARFGGLDRDWSTHIRIGAILAEGCGSTAWIQCVVGVHSWIAARLPLQGQIDIWGASPDILIATAIAGALDSKLEEQADGYVLSGRWRYASGIDHADWVILGAMPDDVVARREHDFLELAVPKAEITVVDTWNTDGLRGTGSNEVVADQVFVPRHRTIARKAMRSGTTEGSRDHGSYIHHVKFSQYFGSVPLGPILGAAKGAVNAYRALTRTRTGEMRKESVATQVPVQTRLAESASEIRAAEALFERIMTLLDDAGREHRPLGRDEWVKIRADGAFIGRLCNAAVDRLVKTMGAGGLARDNTVRRYAADLFAMTAHISQQWDLNASPFGAWALGVPTDNHEINQASDRADDLF